MSEAMSAQSGTTTDDGIDFDRYVDPNVQAIRICDYANGDRAMIEKFHAELLEEQARGWCNVLFMDDTLAIVQWNDQFVLSLNFDHPMVASSIPEGV